MADRDEAIAARVAHNAAELMELGPGLRRTTRVWVVAKDPQAGKVLLGGLGALGVGRMWTGRTDAFEDDETYADAPYQSWAQSTELGGGADRFHDDQEPF